MGSSKKLKPTFLTCSIEDPLGVFKGMLVREVSNLQVDNLMADNLVVDNLVFEMVHFEPVWSSREDCLSCDWAD